MDDSRGALESSLRRSVNLSESGEKWSKKSPYKRLGFHISFRNIRRNSEREAARIQLLTEIKKKIHELVEEQARNPRLQSVPNSPKPPINPPNSIIPKAKKPKKEKK